MPKPTAWFALFALAACDLAPSETADPFATSSVDTGTSQVAPPAPPRLYRTCGDPVCQGYQGPYPGVPSCGTYAEGDRCPRRALGLQCDPVDACNTRLQCARQPNPFPCPISLREHKHDIDYLDVATTDALYEELKSFKLATWRYNWDSQQVRPHLGFVIDDVAPSAAVAQDGGHVDLYGYTTMTVASVQAQARRIEQLEAEVAALKALLTAQVAQGE